MDEVYMDSPAVEQMSTRFGQIGELLDGVNKALEVIANMLRAAAFIGAVGAAVLLHFVERIKPQIKRMADKCKELSRDLTASVRAYERGDQQGATRFY